MHVWKVWLEYKTAINTWQPHTAHVIATEGTEVLDVLSARFPHGVKLQSYVQLADRPHLLLHWGD